MIVLSVRVITGIYKACCFDFIIFKLQQIERFLKERMKGWGNYHDIADACLTFEDLVKLQLDSPLLTGIRGVVKTNDGPYVAVDAEAVNTVTNGNM